MFNHSFSRTAVSAAAARAALSTMLALALGAGALLQGCEQTRYLAGPGSTDTLTLTDTAIVAIVRHDTVTVTRTIVDTIVSVVGGDTVYVLVPDTLIVTDTLAPGAPGGFSSVTVRNVSAAGSQWNLRFSLSADGAPLGNGYFGPGQAAFFATSQPGGSIGVSGKVEHLTLGNHRNVFSLKLHLVPGDYAFTLDNGVVTLSRADPPSS
jgi:hypothetical protein